MAQAQILEMAENGTQMAIERFAWPLTERKLGKKNQFEKQILVNTPARFIKGNAAREYQLVYNASMAVGNGTEGRRAIVLKVLERMPGKHGTA